MKRRHLLTVFLCHIFYDLTKRCVINIHIRYKYKAGQLIFLTKFPCFLRTDFHAGLTGNNDYCRIGRTDSFFYLTYKIKKSGRIQHVDLNAFPFDRNNGSGNGYLSFLLLLTIIADRIAICHLTHTGSNACKICHCFYQTGLTAAPMAQQHYVTNFVSCVNIHILSSNSVIFFLWQIVTRNICPLN